MAIAHTRNTAGVRQDLVDHLTRVADLAARFAEPFQAQDVAYLVGLLHDIGKFTPEFQHLLDAEANPKAPRHR